MMKNIAFLSISIFFLVSGISQTPEPTPKVGKMELKEMIKLHFTYPENDLKEGNQGEVKILFTTDKDGNVETYHIEKSITDGIDSVALTIFKIILWNPATYDHKPVDGKGVFVMDFKINKFNRLVKRRGYKQIILPHSKIDNSNVIHQLKEVDQVPNPIFNNGESTLNEYIYSNLKYPEAAIKTGLEGDVKLNFIIEKNGLASNIIAIEYLGGGCTEEAIRLIRNIQWYPALIDDNAVRSEYNIVIKFKKPVNGDNYIPNQQGSGI